MTRLGLIANNPISDNSRVRFFELTDNSVQSLPTVEEPSIIDQIEGSQNHT